MFTACKSCASAPSRRPPPPTRFPCPCLSRAAARPRNPSPSHACRPPCLTTHSCTFLDHTLTQTPTNLPPAPCHRPSPPQGLGPARGHQAEPPGGDGGADERPRGAPCRPCPARCVCLPVCGSLCGGGGAAAGPARGDDCGSSSVGFSYPLAAPKVTVLEAGRWLGASPHCAGYRARPAATRMCAHAQARTYAPHHTPCTCASSRCAAWPCSASHHTGERGRVG